MPSSPRTRTDTLTSICPNAGPHVRAKALSNMLKLPLNRVRIRHINSGGAFGGRSEVAPGDLVASLLAIKSGRPVKLVLSREENATSSRQVHDIIATIKTGMKKDGTILAKDYKVIYDGGAYSSTGPIATSIPFYVYEECYRFPNVRYNGYRVFTNKGIRGMYGCHGRAFFGRERSANGCHGKRAWPRSDGCSAEKRSKGR